MILHTTAEYWIFVPNESGEKKLSKKDICIVYHLFAIIKPMKKMEP